MKDGIPGPALSKFMAREKTLPVSDPDEGVCADPVNGGAILGRGEPEPQGGNKERQLRSDKGREKT
jgi:hypothetical protein